MKPKLADGIAIIEDLMKWLQIPITDSTKDTPRRVAKMYVDELFSGLYNEKPTIKTFQVKDKQYVSITDIYFTSFCEHHLLPFYGKCGVVYFTEGEVIGLSKIPRIVEYWSSRPQLQEQLTNQIAEDLMERLKPLGVYVAMSAEHMCMQIRGIKARGSKTNTAKMLGEIDKQESMRLLQMDKFFD